jgi:hypothetical protein
LDIGFWLPDSTHCIAPAASSLYGGAARDVLAWAAAARESGAAPVGRRAMMTVLRETLRVGMRL